MIGNCLASKAIMQDGAKIGYMFREKSDFEDDTGWRFFTGDESLDFIDEEDNIEIYEMEEVLKQDPAIMSYLDKPVGTELERITNSEDFAEVEST